MVHWQYTWFRADHLWRFSMLDLGSSQRITSFTSWSRIFFYLQSQNYQRLSLWPKHNALQWWCWPWPGYPAYLWLLWHLRQCDSATVRQSATVGQVRSARDPADNWHCCAGSSHTPPRHCTPTLYTQYSRFPFNTQSGDSTNKIKLKLK